MVPDIKNDKYAEEKQDLDLTVPWYQIGSGTKAIWLV